MLKLNNENRPKKILHTGDIHWFPIKQHDFFYEAQDALLQIIKDEQVDLVYLGGDITDTKNQLSPEQYLNIQNFLFDIAQLCPIVMIIGNHDFNYQNKERIDALSPIVANLNQNVCPNNPIYYLPYSGIFQLYGINWVVWSQLDDLNPFEVTNQQFWESKKTIPTIGCFHGPINGCLSDGGYKLTAPTTVETFKDCDYVFLADIHKRQSFRKGEIQYCGSWVELSFGEAEIFTNYTSTKQNQKGVLVWEFDQHNNLSSSFHPIETQYGHKIFQIKDLSQTIDLSNVQIGRKSKVRVDYVGDSANWSAMRFDEIKKQIQSLVDTKVGWQYTPVNNKKNNSIQLTPSSQQLTKTELFTQYFEKLNIDADTIDLLRVIDSELDSKLDKKDWGTGQYVIETLTLHNFVSFGADNKIDFRTLNGTIGLFAPNRYGKSSILDAICFVLFNEPTKQINSVSELINDQINEECFVEMTIVINGVRFRIKRTITPPNNQGVTRLKLEVYEIQQNGIEVAKHDKDRKVTDQWIRSLIGDREMFLMTSLSSQKNKVDFVDNKNKERLDLLIRILGLTEYDKKLVLIGEEVKAKKIQIESLIKFLPIETVTQLKIELRKALKEKQAIHSELIDLIDHLNEAKLRFSSIQKSVFEIAIEYVADSKKDLLAQRSVKETMLEVEKRNLNIAQQNVIQFEQQLTPIIEWQPKDAEKLFDSNLALKHIKKDIESELCSVCKQKRIDWNKDDLIAQQTQLETEIESLTQRKLDFENWTAINGKKQKEQNLIKGLLEVIAKYEKVIIAIDNKISIIEKNEETIETKKQLLIELEKEQQQVDDLNKRIAILTQHQAKINSMYENKQKSLQTTIDLRAEIEENQEFCNLLELYQNSVRRTAIPSLILRTFIPLINYEVNSYLSDLFDFKVVFELDSDKLDIFYVYDGLKNNKRNISMTSGAEGFITNLAIRVALNKISLLPRASILFVDEGFDVLDEDGIQNCKTLFGKLQNDFEHILIITHLDVMKDFPQHLIELEQSNGITNIA